MRCVLFESAVVDTINKHNSQPPLEVPIVLQTHVSSLPYYSVFKRVGKKVIGQQDLRKLTTKELENYGTGIGNFVAWMERAITLDKYGDIYDSAGRPQIFDRKDFVHTCPNYVKDEPIPNNLKKLLLDVRDELMEREKDGDITPTIVGHDDLWVGNVAFSGKGDGLKLEGIFDFGLTKPSSPERELRALAPLPAALEAGIASYERSTSRQVARELIGFWSIAQVATNYAGMIKAKNYVGAEGKRIDLGVLLPGINWAI